MLIVCRCLVAPVRGGSRAAAGRRDHEEQPGKADVTPPVNCVYAKEISALYFRVMHEAPGARAGQASLVRDLLREYLLRDGPRRGERPPYEDDPVRGVGGRRTLA